MPGKKKNNIKHLKKPGLDKERERGLGLTINFAKKKPETNSRGVKEGNRGQGLGGSVK